MLTSLSPLSDCAAQPLRLHVLLVPTLAEPASPLPFSRCASAQPPQQQQPDRLAAPQRFIAAEREASAGEASGVSDGPTAVTALARLHGDGL